MTRHVLVIEDDESFSDLVREVLEMAGYEVTTTTSGFGVPSLVRRLNPCAVLLDLGLPYRPGTSVMAELKADPRTRAVPVVILTGMADALSGDRRAQASKVLSKPVSLEELLDAIEQVAAAA